MFKDVKKIFGAFDINKDYEKFSLKHNLKKTSILNLFYAFYCSRMDAQKIQKKLRKGVHRKLKINNIKILSAVLLTSLLLFAFWTETDDININNAALYYNKVYAEKSENESNVEPIEKEVTDESAKNDSSETDIIRSCSNVDKKQVVLPCTISEFGEKSVCDIFVSMEKIRKSRTVTTSSFHRLL